MTHGDTLALIAHLHAMYPKAKEHWPAERQQAFSDHCRAVKLGLDQAKAAASHVAMSLRSRTPPESVILEAMRRAAREGTRDRGNGGPTWLDIWRGRQRKLGAQHGFSEAEIIRAEAWAVFAKTYERALSDESRAGILRAFEEETRQLTERAQQPLAQFSGGGL